jgi:hypothetical protein
MDRDSRTWTTTTTSRYHVATTQPALQPQKMRLEKLEKDWMETIGRIEKSLDRLGYPKLSTATRPFSTTSPPSRSLKTSRDVTLACPAPSGTTTTSPSPYLDPRLDGRPTATLPMSSQLDNRALRPSRPPPPSHFDSRLDGCPTATSPVSHQLNSRLVRPLRPPPSRFDSRVDGYASARPPSPHFESRLDAHSSLAFVTPS